MTGLDRADGPAGTAPRSSGIEPGGSPALPRTAAPAEEGAGWSPIRSAAAVIALCAALVVVLLVALTVGGGRPTSVTPGLPQAGPFVDWSLPVATLASRIAGLSTVGCLLFAAVLLPAPGRRLPAASLRAVRAASLCALAWAGTTTLSALLTLCSLVGVPLTSLPASSVPTFFEDVAAGRAALVVVALAACLAVFAGRCTTPGAAGLLLAVAVAGLVVPAVLTGHSAAARSHVLAVTNLSVHVVAAAVWVGGLLALVLLARSHDELSDASARFSKVALACFLATGASGLLAAWLVLGGGIDGLAASAGTGYGWVLSGKTTALAVLGIFGWHHRRGTLPRLRAGEPGSFRRFAAVEAVVMLATIALAVALSASPPPATAPSSPSPSTSSGAQAPQPQPSTAPPPPDNGAMAGHDHGELSVSVLIDRTRFHVSGPVAAGTPVTVFNETTTEVTITASDGSFDVVVPGSTLLLFTAPERAGTYPFFSRHAPSFTGVLVVG